MNQEELNTILEKHALWLDVQEGGERANLSRANLSCANLSCANLSRADLSRANLSRANLSRANLSRANLSRADLSRADLSGADLFDANLFDANLFDANLYRANGNLKEIKSLFLDTWPITYTDEILQIGCKQYPINEWFEFDDDRIDGMDSFALKWWNKYKDLIKLTIELSPAVGKSNVN